MTNSSKRKSVKTEQSVVEETPSVPAQIILQDSPGSLAGINLPVVELPIELSGAHESPELVGKKSRGRQPKGGKAKVDPDKIERLPGLIKAAKLRSPEFHVYGVVGFHTETGEPHICIEKHDGHGLFSKDWISFTDIAAVLSSVSEPAFSSGILKPLFRSASANNTGFLAALLRSRNICFLTSVPGSKYKHAIDPQYQQNLTALKAKALNSFTSYKNRHPMVSSEA